MSALFPGNPCALARHSFGPIARDTADDLAGRDVAGEVLRWHYACEIFEHLLSFRESGRSRRPQRTTVGELPEDVVAAIRARISRTAPVLALRLCYENPVAGGGMVRIRHL